MTKVRPKRSPMAEKTEFGACFAPGGLICAARFPELGGELSGLPKTPGFVSGYRFSGDTASPSKSNAPAGAELRVLILAACPAAASTSRGTFKA